jgi:hypothetical protein
MAAVARGLSEPREDDEFDLYVEAWRASRSKAVLGNPLFHSSFTHFRPRATRWFRRRPGDLIGMMGAAP